MPWAAKNRWRARSGLRKPTTCCVCGPTTKASTLAWKTPLEQTVDRAGCRHDYADTVGKDHGRIETHRCGDRVTTATRCSISSLPPPRPNPYCRRCASTGASKTPTTGSWMSPSARMTAASARDTPPTIWPSPAHRPQAAGSRLEQGLPVPANRPQAQIHLDAIALGRRLAWMSNGDGANPYTGKHLAS